MEQPKQSFRVEFKDSEDGDARIGMLRLSSSRLHFVEDGNASKSFSLELNEVEALRQETETSSTDGSSCTLLLRCTDGRLLRVKAIDSTFLRQLAQEIEKLQSLDDKAMTSAVSSASPGNGSAVFSPEKPRFRFQTIGFTKLISVEVLPPVDVVWGPESYASFPVRTMVQMQGAAQAEWIVYHRFSDFERFDAKLRQLVLDHLDQLPLPAMVSKPWIPQPSSREFQLSRARKLTRYLVALVALPELQQRVTYLESLLSFLSDGENWNGASSTAMGGSLLGKGIHAANSGLSKLLDARDPPSAQEDFEYVSSLLRKHGIRAQQLKFAWSKLCVCIFGTTSSGKSSLVNHLFTLVAASSSGAGQVDTGFSIFETVSDAEFRRMSPEAGPERDFSVQQLREPLKPADQNLRGDARYGHVFVYLTAEETLARYSQQLGDEPTLKKFDKLRTVLINEKYLRGTPDEIGLARRLLVIDSKGIDANAFSAHDAALGPELAAMHFMGKISALNLFLIPANDIRNCSAAISIYELIVVSTEEQLQVLRDQKRRSAEDVSGNSSDPFSGLLYRMMGIDSVIKTVASSIAGLVLPARSAVQLESGTSRWQKTLFILSRADQAVQPGDKQAKEQLAYELGVAFGARLSYLQPPAFARIALLALPEKQLPGPALDVGFLVEFRSYLTRQAAASSYDDSRDEAIVQMTELLQQHMQQQSWISMAYFKFQGPYIRDARARALARRFAAQKKIVL